jgi:hypothetical protein
MGLASVDQTAHICKVLFTPRPPERVVLAGAFEQRVLVGGGGLLEECRPRLALTEGC